MADRIIAEAFPPGEFLKEELEARGWSQLDLAEITGIHARTVNEISTGKRMVTPNTASKIGEALGTGSQFWMNLEAVYQLYILSKPTNGDIARRAKLFEKAPVRELKKRGWIDGANDPEILEQQLLEFFEIESLDDEPLLWAHAARKSSSYSEVTASQWAWLFRAKKLARCVDAQKFSQARLVEGMKSLKNCIEHPKDTRQVARILSDCGVRLVIVEPLSGTKIDGACFWLDRFSPVAALSLRYDRIDWFWHTLMHEIGHISRKDGLKGSSLPLDVDLIARKSDRNERPESEIEADRLAVEFLVDQSELQDFIARTSPLYSKSKIRNFSSRVHVHPGIIVGQLQYLGEIGWRHSRDMLETVRDFVTDSTLTDGWGFIPLNELQ